MKYLLSLVIIFCTFFSFSQEKVKITDWFSMMAETKKEWQAVAEVDDNLRVQLRPRDIDGTKDIKKVLVLFPKKSSAYDTAMDTIINVFFDKGIQAQFTLINFKNKQELGFAALDYGEEHNFDLIFSMGSNSTFFVHDHYRNGKLSVVTVCSKDPVRLFADITDYNTGSGTNIAYTSLDISIDLQLDYILKLNRNLKNIVILYAVNNTSAVRAEVEPLKEECTPLGIIYFDLAVEDQKKAKIELEKKIPVVVNEIKKIDPELEETIFWITGSTSVFNEIETIDKYASGIPVLASKSNVVAEGDHSAVLSIGVSFENNALIAALYGAGILTGEYKVKELPVGVVSPPDIAINFRKAREIGLKIPFIFFESASYIYNYDGELVRKDGQKVDNQ